MSFGNNLDDERRERAKTLKRERDRRYRERHREERRASGRRYYAANPEKMKRKAALWTMTRAWGDLGDMRRALSAWQFNELLLSVVLLAKIRGHLRRMHKVEREG